MGSSTKYAKKRNGSDDDPESLAQSPSPTNEPGKQPLSRDLPDDGVGALKAKAFDASPDSQLIIDAEGRIVAMNCAAEAAFGWSGDAVIGQYLPDVIAPPDLRHRYGQLLRAASRVQRTGSLGRRVETVALRGNGETFPAALILQQLDEDTQGGIAVYLFDITEERRLAQDHRHLAQFDQLTGLPNRVVFIDRVAAVMALSSKSAVVYINLDEWRMLLSGLGREFADELLVAFTRRVEKCLSPGDLLARVQANAFAALIESDTEAGIAQSVDRIEETLRHPFILGRRNAAVTASIGVALASADYRRPEELLRDAEVACYQAATTEGTRRVFFDESMRSRLVDRLRMESDLRRALDVPGELWLAFQPIVELASGRPVGFEALVRWDHPRCGRILPDDFVPLAEASGLINRLGEFVLREAVRQLAQWQRLAGVGHPLFMSVNISPLQLGSARLTAALREALDSTSINAATLKLEITEGVIMGTGGAALDELRNLRGLGIGLAIDDFGTGYSSLSYLARLPIDTLKIDQSFVRNMRETPGNEEIIRAIAELSGRLNLDMIAEGVETELSARRLLSLGVVHAQGDFLGRPMPAQEVTAMLEARSSVSA